MSDPTQPVTKLTIGKEEYALQFDFEAIAEAEDALDRPLITGLSQRDVNRPKISTVRSMFYAALRRSRPDLTFEQASALVTVQTLRTIWQAVVIAYGHFCADPEDSENPPAAQS